MKQGKSSGLQVAMSPMKRKKKEVGWGEGNKERDRWSGVEKEKKALP